MRTRGFFTTRRLAAASITLTLACSIAACGDNGSDYEYSASFTPQTSSTTTTANTEEATVTEQSSTEASRDPKPTVSRTTTPDRSCGEDKEANEIYRNISKVPDDSSGDPWFYNGYSNYDPCLDLSFAVLSHNHGASRFQSRQIMLFHKGEYLGVGSDRLTVHFDFVNITDDSITVKYLNPHSESGSPQEDYDNALDVTYRWDGEKVQMLGYDG